MTSQLEEDNFDRSLRHIMRSTREISPIVNLAARAIERTKIEKYNMPTFDSARLGRYSVFHQILSILTATGVIVFALFAFEYLFPGNALGTADISTPAADSVFESLDFFQMLQVEQTSVTALGMILVLTVFLIVHIILSQEPYYKE